MNIAKLIAKFIKLGLSALSADEKEVLKSNIDFMSSIQKAKFQKALDEAGDGDDEGEDDEDAGDEAGADAGADDGADAGADDGAVDEKALREMIAKGVDSEITKKVDAISEQIVNKFMKGANASRKRVIASGKGEATKGCAETRSFLKALLSKDTAKLAEFRAKETTFNQTGDNDRGAYLIPEELRAEVLRLAQNQYGIARRDFMYLPFTGPGNERKIPTLATGVTVTWTDEAVKKSSSNPTFGVVTQTLKKLAAIIPFTEEILEDSAINLTQLVAQLFAEAVAKEEDVQFFTGTGSPWTGILANTSTPKVTLGTNKDMSDITADDLLDMIDACPSGALAGAKFYFNRHALSYIRKLKDSVTGQYIFQRPADGLPGTIWDYPYELVEAMPDKTAGEAQNLGIACFGNLRMAAILGDKQQIRAKVLDQATITDGNGSTVINLAEQDMIAIRLEERVGYVLALPAAVVVLKTGAAS